MEIPKVACFTGHRPDVLGGYDKEAPKNVEVRNFLREHVQRLKGDGYTTFISGGALGVDQWAADVVLEDPELELVVALPFKDYGNNWPPESQVILKDQCSKAKRIHIVCEGDYSPHKNHLRNQWMVDNCNLVIAVWNGFPKGGTASCVRYAQRVGKPMLRYNPEDGSVDMPQDTVWSA
jgi:uncharacterized phage-like protein YoqJ